MMAVEEFRKSMHEAEKQDLLIVISGNLNGQQQELEQAFEEYNFLPVWAKENGESLRQEIQRVQPDAVLMSTYMPGKDALTLLEESRELMMAGTDFFVVGENDSWRVIQRLLECGTQYYFFAPVDCRLLTRRMFEIINLREDKQMQKAWRMEGLESQMTELFRMLGIPAHIKGYSFLKKGVMIAINDRHVLNAVTKELYPEIARESDSTAMRVERSIRHALETSWEKGDKVTQKQLFGYCADGKTDKPTNGQFITAVVDYLNKLLEQNGECIE